MAAHVTRAADLRALENAETNGLGDDRLAAIVRDLLVAVGENPEREGLALTPDRVARAWRFFTDGYTKDIGAVVNDALFHEAYDEMVIVKEIDFFSLCEHHLLPFYGRCHVAYIPDGTILGLSKIPRIVDVFARRLQVQERMTQEIARTLQDVLRPQGVGVICEARHMCMMMRGVEKQNSLATTSAMLGVFQDDPKTRAEFLNLVGTTAQL